MKFSIISFLVGFMSFFQAYAQDLNYEIRGQYERPLQKAAVQKATMLDDIITGYPKNWISEYVSVEVTTSQDGTSTKTFSNNNILTAEQTEMLKRVVLGTVVNITIHYKYKNSVTNQLDPRKLDFAATIIPQTEAYFDGGHPVLKAYLKENAIDKMVAAGCKFLKNGMVRFTVKENGTIDNVKVHMSSEDAFADKTIEDVIKNMPSWVPATSDGVAVKQDFEFVVGPLNGC